MSQSPHFDAFFAQATSGPGEKRLPYDYQRRLAGGDAGRSCESQLISIPTGLGKTAAVVLAWLWNRVGHPNAGHRNTWPRRLVICLPMRTLVEQTEEAARTWLEAVDSSETVDVRVLMGGEDRGVMRDWDLHPERPAILIGTQDMLLSRALNRGYGMSRYRWPMHFGLLNNDALWVFDELQLMGVSVETSAQLNGFRQKLGLARGCHSWWMSATLDTDRLRTIDHAAIAATLSTIRLAPDEKQTEAVKRRVDSYKKLLPAALALTKATEKTYERQLADYILSPAVHRTRTFTLVIVNRVPRARELFRLLQKTTSKLSEADRPKLALIHSRFRSGDRARHTAVLTDHKITHKIVVATQAIEAGVDVSAKTLVTELAPWSSLVQRFGRCNRAGEHTDSAAPASIHWIDLDPSDKNDLALPYEAEELAPARAALQSLTEAGPAALSAVSVLPREVVRPVIRRKDFIELFDTTPDIAGHDLDISRYIREGDDTDAQVAWRALAKDHSPAPGDPRPLRDELCRVPVGALNEFLKKQDARAYVWNPLLRDWEALRAVRPGSVCVLSTDVGGYDDNLGWTADKKSEVTPLALPDKTPSPANADEADYGDNSDAQTGCWQTIAEHTADVQRELAKILEALPASAPEIATLQNAARLHDIGKAHPYFQTMLAGEDPERRRTLWAKSPHKGTRNSRPFFRHELASALAILAHPDSAKAEKTDLVAYLVAAHHGKVRVSIRSLPGEEQPPVPDQRFARGIWEGDELPRIPLADGAEFPATTLSLACMELGSRDSGQSPSWLTRMIALRDAPDLGPLRLAWLETLLRAADMRASALANQSSSTQVNTHELAANRHAMAQTPLAGEAAPPLGQHSHAGGAEHGLRERTGGREDPSRATRPEHATRYVETSRGLLSYAALAPLLAERVQSVEVDLSQGAFADLPISDELVLELHRRIVGDLIPDWAGRWRSIAVTVGRLSPPAPHLVAEKMRNYGLDLQARWPEAATTLGDLTLEFLAFAEGRFLTIHPFADFNGRTVRVFLGELLRRLDLPPVQLEAEGETARVGYFAALEAADSGDFRPLTAIWRQRFSNGKIPLHGCCPTPIAHYLKSLGVLSALSSEAGDIRAQGSWSRDTFYLQTKLSVPDLVDYFLNHYSPTSVLAPWNNDGGFFDTSRKAARETLLSIEASKADRLKSYRSAIKTLRAATSLCGLKEAPEDKDQKERLLMACRTTLPDDALRWLDASVLLTDTGAKYPPLLGTGGNDGSLEFTKNFMQRLAEIFDLSSGNPTQQSEAWLRQSLFATAIPVARIKAPIGQFFPAAAGGANATSGFNAESSANPWDFIFMIEGALVFAAAAVKRLESIDDGRLAYPFCVRQAGIGYASASTADESASRAEMWMPLWDKPATYAELSALFSEGRAQVGGRSARNGVDFIRAVVTLGIDRGITAFQRFGFQVRNGLAYFATPLERVIVRQNTRANLLVEIDRWLDQLRRFSGDGPASVSRAVRGVETAIDDLCRHDDALHFRALLGALGRAEQTLARSFRWTTEKRLQPLQGLSSAWLKHAFDTPDTDRELRLAASLASAFGGALRSHLEPVEGRGFWKWESVPGNNVCWSEGGLERVLLEILSRRLTVSEKAPSLYQGRAAWFASLDDIEAFIRHELDDALIADLWWALSALDWKNAPRSPRPISGDVPSALYSLLRICFPQPGEIRLSATTVPAVPAIVAKARAGLSREASALAVRRLRASGFRPRLDFIEFGESATCRVTAALLFPLHPDDFVRLQTSVLRQAASTTA